MSPFNVPHLLMLISPWICAIEKEVGPWIRDLSAAEAIPEEAESWVQKKTVTECKFFFTWGA